jgi:hypothetical protein
MIAVVMASALGLGACAQTREAPPPPTAKKYLQRLVVYCGRIRPRGQVVFRPGLFLFRISHLSHTARGTYATDGYSFPSHRFPIKLHEWN